VVFGMLLLRLGNLWLGNAMTTHCVLGDNDELTTEAAALEKPGHDFRVYEGVYEDKVEVDVSLVIVCPQTLQTQVVALL